MAGGGGGWRETPGRSRAARTRAKSPVGRPHRRRLLRAGALALAAVLLAAAPAAAEVEWCDEGSPPPNDFRLQPTGSGSQDAPLSWLRSTSDGASVLTTYVATGKMDAGGVTIDKMGSLQGGVATGMKAATAARPH